MLACGLASVARCILACMVDVFTRASTTPTCARMSRPKLMAASQHCGVSSLASSGMMALWKGSAAAAAAAGDPTDGATNVTPECRGTKFDRLRVFLSSLYRSSKCCVAWLRRCA
eukprot:363517-Chlamydomonas_euryale.AAC.6